ncbi:hypothetical protein GM415_12720 [Pseudodesulfovibrio cashew]|uniref:HEAT repeat domain-containing protein n=1 Tax=Pseudodesulfovibrio cashew TaxID=2678688 RepID=A0A6I6JKZ6_9BACT|nr:hypothetical protein [Pseudodesulfovibrio cashew]QGY40953.1 hypothetical protein GM415_12720 [Pseudodesulfovibrio cashew]
MSRLSHLATLLLLTCLVIPPALAQTGTDAASSPLDEMHYYLHPTPELLPAYLAFWTNHPPKDSDTLNLAALFLATALDGAPQYAPETLAKAEGFPPQRQQVAIAAAWLMHDEYGHKYLTKMAAKGSTHAARLLKARKPNLKAISRPNPFHLDCFWAIFGATGEKWPIKKIITALDGGEPDGKITLVQATARWSLTVNAKQHPIVVETIREALPEASPKLKQRLQEILDAQQ